MPTIELVCKALVSYSLGHPHVFNVTFYNDRHEKRGDTFGNKRGSVKSWWQRLSSLLLESFSALIENIKKRKVALRATLLACLCFLYLSLILLGRALLNRICQTRLVRLLQMYHSPVLRSGKLLCEAMIYRVCEEKKRRRVEGLKKVRNTETWRQRS